LKKGVLWKSWTIAIRREKRLARLFGTGMQGDAFKSQNDPAKEKHNVQSQEANFKVNGFRQRDGSGSCSFVCSEFRQRTSRQA
jgi:hypothetical protein